MKEILGNAIILLYILHKKFVKDKVRIRYEKNLIAPGSISVVQASEVEIEQTEGAGQNTDVEESEEVGEEPTEEETVTEKPEQEEAADAIGQSESNDSTDLSVDTQAEKGVIKDSGACGATENDDVTWTMYDTDSDG